MEAMATPSSSYSYRNYTTNNRSLSNQPSASKPPALQIRFPLRSPKQDGTHIINNKSEISKTTTLPQNNLTKSSRSWRKNNKKTTTTTTTTTSDVLRLMDSLGLRIPPDIYAYLIRECTLTADSTRAAELLLHISRSGLRPPLSLLNRLLLMNVSCGLLDTARHLFDRMTLKNFISWATMIVGYANDGYYDEAISLFVKMQHQFTMLEFPTWIIVCVLEACVCTTTIGLGKQVHGCLHKLGVANHDLFLTSSLIDFYGKLKCQEGADFVFNQLSIHNTMTWTARIISSCREEHFCDVFSYFKEMGRAGIKKSTFTFSSVLRACGRIQDDGNCGRQVHANAIKLGLDKDAFVQCGLVDMYGRNGLLRDAKLVFEMVDDKRNVACWNAMVAGYMRNGFKIEAIKFLYRMKAAGVLPPESLINEEYALPAGKCHVERTATGGIWPCFLMGNFTRIIRFKAVFSTFKDVRVIQFSSMQDAFLGFNYKTMEQRFKNRVKRYVGIWCCVGNHTPGHRYYDMYWDEKPGWKPILPQTPDDDHPPL